MSKYDKVVNYGMDSVDPLVDGESLIWSSTPKKSAYIMNRILVMMPIALLWLAFDSVFIISLFGSVQGFGTFLFAIPFFAFHLFPVWIWLSNVITANRRWKNTKYYVTDRRIIIQDGLIAENYQTIYYKDIKNVNLRVGMIDNMLDVGDIYFDLGYSSNKGIGPAFLDIENPKEVYSMVQKVVMDIQTDIEYPNALRPDENPGYQTKYHPKK